MGLIADLRKKRRIKQRRRKDAQATKAAAGGARKVARNRHLPQVADKLTAAVKIAARKAKGLGREIEALTKRIRNIIERRNEDDTPTPKPEHGNGHEWHNLTWRAKVLLAIAVEKYGLQCTSITRDWGTGSHHEEVPTRGFDCAGSRMVEFQRDLRYGRIEGYPLSGLLELYGPDNVACADSGVGVTMPEGTPNEELHDNHVHAFVYG
jgi:hypothetical protein